MIKIFPLKTAIFAVVLVLAQSATFAQDWKETLSEPLLQKEELKVSLPLEAGTHLYTHSQINCPKKEISYKFSKYITKPDIEVSETELQDVLLLKKKAHSWFELLMQNNKLTTSNFVKNEGGSETTKSSITQYDMLQQAYAYLKSLEPVAFELGCANTIPTVKELNFDLNEIQLKVGICDQNVCILQVGDFWEGVESNIFLRKFASASDATNWYEFVNLALKKAPTVSYDKRISSTTRKVLIQKSIKNAKLLLGLHISEKENTVTVQTIF